MESKKVHFFGIYTFLEFTATYNTIIFNGDFRKGEKDRLTGK